jgi:Ca2+-binding EF-hand superfamily protein
MQISSTPTAYGGGEAQRLLNMLLQPQAPPAGQDLPGSSPAASTTASTATSAPPPPSAPSVAQFASDTLASLLTAQEAPPTASSVAAKVIGAADTNGDGSLSLSEVETALGQDTTTGAEASSGANALSQAFSSVDANGDGQISADELTNALQAQKGSQGAHHHHHAHGAHGGGPSSTDLASTLLGSADTDGDGELSVSEIEGALGVSASASSDATDMLTSAIGKLDTNGDGKLSASELGAGINAFLAAHHRGASEAAQTPSAQAVTA